jgi:hypothetical protein
LIKIHSYGLFQTCAKKLEHFARLGENETKKPIETIGFKCAKYNFDYQSIR